MKFSIKTTLTALTLMVTAFSIYCAEHIDPAILAESKRLEAERQKRIVLEQSQIDAAVHASRRLEEEKAIHRALEQSKKEQARQKKKKNEEAASEALAKKLDREERQRRDTLAASELVARELQEAENKHRQTEYDRKVAQQLAEKEAREHKEAGEQKQKAEHPIRGFAPTIFYRVHPQTGAACGLFALDNGNKAYLSLVANEPSEALKNKLLQPLSAQAEAIKARDMLDGHQIGTIGRNILKMKAACFTVLPNLLQSKDEFLKPFPQKTAFTYIPDTLGTAVQALRTNARATHVFVIADAKIARDASGKLVGHDDHWISIVADKKDGIITFHYMDTGGGKRDDIINALREIIEHGNYYGMQLTPILENPNLNTIQRAINGGSYRPALNALEQRVDLAHKAGVINNPHFPKKDIIGLLALVELIAAEPYKTQAHELLNRLR